MARQSPPKKAATVHILSIAVDSAPNEELLDSKVEGKPASPFIYGLGSDGRVYFWSTTQLEWYLAART